MRKLALAVFLGALAVGSGAAQPMIAPSSIDTPVASRGLDPVPTGWPVVIVTQQVIALEAKSIVVVKDGAVDAADKDGGGLGDKITRLTKFAQALIAADKAPPAGFVIAIDEKLSYRLLLEVLFSVKSAGVRRFGILGKTGKSLGVVPLTLPNKVTSAVNGKLAPPRPTPVKPVVTVTKSRVLLWSISGLEGTLKVPKLTLGRSELAKLTAGLAEIATRRFGNAKRADDDRQIIVMADAATSIKDVIDVLVAVRTTGEGDELFSDVLLSEGFE